MKIKFVFLRTSRSSYISLSPTIISYRNILSRISETKDGEIKSSQFQS
jgi:hypothetical protein